MNILKNRTKLVVYCKWLADQYNLTNEGKYRIKYNDLYPLLYHSISPEKRDELWKSFKTSLDFNPVQKTSNGIQLVQI